MKIQAEFLTRVENKHREICTKNGISFSLNQSRADDL